MNARRHTTIALLSACLLQTACSSASGDYRAQPPDAELLHSAVQHMTDVIVYDIFSPPQAARAYAYASVAAYEALRHDDATYRTLAGQLNGLTPIPAPRPDSDYYLPLAGVHAFLTVAKTLTFSQKRMDSLRTAMHERVRRMRMPAPVFDRSVAYGELVAQHILAWSRTDNFLQTRGYAKYTVSSEPGRWVPTPPGYMDAVEPSWAKVRPFAMDSAGQFRPNPPIKFDMTVGSPFYRQAMEVYEAGRSITDDQRALVNFWDDNAYVMNVRGHAMYATKKATPGGHWLGITAIAARKARASLMQSADAYVRTAIAVHDGFISCWDEKFRSNVVRPETVINAHIDAAWQPLLQTPPFPEYTSGHSVISTAAATVLTGAFGENFAFTDSTEMPYGMPPRAFVSFRQAAAEAAISRLYGGIHYRMAIEEGVAQGRRVGEFLVRRIQTRAPVTVASTTVSSGSSCEAPASS